MAIHFFEESPSPPDEQLSRLDPPISLLKAGIPCVVWAEDALRLLKHHNPNFPGINDKPHRILIHAASVFHFDLDDPSNTCLNPSPPSESSRLVCFPTLAAFYDALIATRYVPPLPYVHMKFKTAISNWLAYLSLYTISDKGMTYYDHKGDTSERTLIPACVDVLRKMKDENQPFLIREFFCMRPLGFEVDATERLILQSERCARMGIPPPPARSIPYNPFYRSRGLPKPTSEPRLTPYLNQRTGGVEWRALAKYASIAHRMLR